MRSLRRRASAFASFQWRIKLQRRDLRAMEAGRGAVPFLRSFRSRGARAGRPAKALYGLNPYRGFESLSPPDKSSTDLLRSKARAAFHPGGNAAARVWQLEPHAEGSARRIEGRVDDFHRGAVDAADRLLRHHACALPHFDLAKLTERQYKLDVERVDFHDLDDRIFLVRAGELAGAQQDRDHHAGDRAVDRALRKQLLGALDLELGELAAFPRRAQLLGREPEFRLGLVLCVRRNEIHLVQLFGALPLLLRDVDSRFSGFHLALHRGARAREIERRELRPGGELGDQLASLHRFAAAHEHRFDYALDRRAHVDFLACFDQAVVIRSFLRDGERQRARKASRERGLLKEHWNLVLLNSREFSRYNSSVMSIWIRSARRAVQKRDFLFSSASHNRN